MTEELLIEELTKVKVSARHAVGSCSVVILASSLIATHWRLQGIGRWTADMFAMFFMGRPGELATFRLKLAIVRSIAMKDALHAIEAFFDPHLLRPLQMCCQWVI